ncbi:helix-turn-helix transcriptional regulator [Jannaschia aquimarina]|uniref:LuxR_1 protein n=1 Tax=Jannaschia aquimarina TaxID=935700 RepID=A0A0D1EH26_9RHOB|nr:LuxR family transcriptional regulator [Jannaschia aquimarina]KIT16191.1 Transcriptional activator protein LuxR [Jannaschia aquimarina]SNT40066.1 LuxR family transcriptional regulator [Jannaschia aquimarina]
MIRSHIPELLDKITKATGVDEVWTLWTSYAEEFGIDRMFYAATHFRTLYGLGDVKDALILTNYSKHYTDIYIEGGLFRDAPMVRWAMTEVGVRSFRDVHRDAVEGRLTPAEMKVLEFNARQGVVAGYAISFPRSSPRAGFGVGLSSTKMNQDAMDELWAEHGAEIELVSHVAHLAMISLPHGDHVRVLTPRQREVLELVADGKTVQDVALILERNPATVEKHLRLAREALDVETTAQAIRKVSVQNQVFLF